MISAISTLFLLFSLLSLLTISLFTVFKYVQEENKLEKVPVRIKDQRHHR